MKKVVAQFLAPQVSFVIRYLYPGKFVFIIYTLKI